MPATSSVRTHCDDAIRRIGVAYNDTDEARSALSAAIALARALQAELEIIGVISPESFTAPAVMGTGIATLRHDVERVVQQRIDAALSEVPEDVTAHGVKVTGEAEELLTTRSGRLDLLVMGSRGYGPLHAVIADGLGGRVLRSAHCPVIIVPCGIDAPLDALFADTTTTAA
jgi:nucleotide-binding universal stress UspA family protein